MMCLEGRAPCGSKLWARSAKYPCPYPNPNHHFTAEGRGAQRDGTPCLSPLPLSLSISLSLSLLEGHRTYSCLEYCFSSCENKAALSCCCVWSYSSTCSQFLFNFLCVSWKEMFHVKRSTRVSLISCQLRLVIIEAEMMQNCFLVEHTTSQNPHSHISVGESCADHSYQHCCCWSFVRVVQLHGEAQHEHTRGGLQPHRSLKMPPSFDRTLQTVCDLLVVGPWHVPEPVITQFRRRWIAHRLVFSPKSLVSLTAFRRVTTFAYLSVLEAK